MIVIPSPNPINNSRKNGRFEIKGKIYKKYNKDNTCANCAMRFKHPQHLGYCYRNGKIVDLDWWCTLHVIKGTSGRF